MKIPPNTKTKILLAVFTLTALVAGAQSYLVTGKIINGDSLRIEGAAITLKNAEITTTVSNSNGTFKFRTLSPGTYLLAIYKSGYEMYTDSFTLTNADINLGIITLHNVTYDLKEVNIVDKIVGMVQKEDTLEFSSSAYKVGQDADAADLVKKLPSLSVRNNRVSAQGEEVVKILIDGKPFFGNDPYATLKLLPANIIAKIQVYNEKSEQEQFTGFSEGQTSKTINIVTKPDKHNGIFGKVYVGTGRDNNITRYGAGADLNRFNGSERITATTHTDNLNQASFTGPNLTTNGGTGYNTTTNAAINYSNKLGKKTDVAGSYTYDEAGSRNEKMLTKTYTTPAGAGQVYREINNSYTHSYNNRINGHIFRKTDSVTTFIISPALSFQHTSGNTQRSGNTSDGLGAINEAINTNRSNVTSYILTGSLLYGHKFRKNGRSISLSVNAADNANESKMLLKGNNTYYSSPQLSDTINQQTIQNQAGSSYNGDLTFTTLAGKNGQLKSNIDISYSPSKNERNTYNYADAAASYSLPDTLLSNTLTNINWNNKAGLSYRFYCKKYEFSAGLNYQLSTLRGSQGASSGEYIERNFRNILPVASYKYRFSRNSNVQVNYSTYTRPPTIGQLQNVVINTDPLHLSTGNKQLVQPYTHTLFMRYSFTGKGGQNSLNCSAGGSYTVNTISTNVILAEKDTLLFRGIFLPKGSQLSMPVNTVPSAFFNTYAGYNMPVAKLKCVLSLNITADYSWVPAIINNVINFQNRTNGSFNIALNSNINEKIDFTIATATAIVKSNNTLNSLSNSTYYNQSGSGWINLVLAKNIVFNTGVTYQVNYGLGAGYNQNYLVWNLSAGKKLFKKQQGDIRISAIDLLNNNTNTQRSVTETYIQDTRSNVLQRYVLLTFTYKLRDFR